MRSDSIDLVRAIDGDAPTWPTRVEVTWNTSGLGVRFECRDDLAWATFTERDAPLWQEEVVEVFLAPGLDDPLDYLEIEVNPLGALFDARVSNPDGYRGTMRVDETWNWPGIQWRAGRLGDRQDWWAELSLPWRGLGLRSMPRAWRVNFLRVERPRGAPGSGDGPADGSEDEYSAWSPTRVVPADFHRPERFGLMVLDSAATELAAQIAAFEATHRPVHVLTRG